MNMEGIPDNNKPNINAIYIFTMSLRALKGRGNPPLRAQRGNLYLFLRDRIACSEHSEGIFFAPRDDTGIIVFVLVTRKKLLTHQ
jgi:hypothetical protein